MATFNFSGSTTVINSKMADTITNVEIGGNSGSIDREEIFALLATWRTNGMPASTYDDLRNAANRIESVGKNEPTKTFTEKLASVAKTGGAILEAYSGLAAIVTRLSTIVA